MEFDLELKRSSKQPKDSKLVEEKPFSLQLNRCPVYPDKLRVNSHASIPIENLYSKSRPDIYDMNTIQAKCSTNHQKKSPKGSSAEGDEMVKHMSKLPDYLLRVEKGESLQGKALNVGVLDWTTLENWKHKQKHIPARASNDVFGSSSRSSPKQTTRRPTLPRVVRSETSFEQNYPPHPKLNSLHRDGPPPSVKSSAQNDIRNRDSKNASKSIIKEQNYIPCTDNSFESKHSEKIREKEKKRVADHGITPELDGSSSKIINNMVPLGPKRNACTGDGESETNKRTEKLIERGIKKKAADEKVILEGEEFPSKSIYSNSLSRKETMTAEDSESRKRVVKLQESVTDFSHKYSQGEQNIVLLLPKQKPPNGFSEEFKPFQPRASFEENVMEVHSSSNSEIFSPEEVFSSELGSEIPHSCPLPSVMGTNAMSDMMMFHNLADDLSMELSSLSFQPNQAPASKGTESHGSELNCSLSNRSNASKMLDQDTTELRIAKGRNPSPNRRFSFSSLSRMGRSFSFKEGSTLPQLSSTHVAPKSGPVKPESTACSDKAKINGHNRARSSPLRRLIEPILKYKSTNTVQVHFEEGNLTSRLWPTGLSESPQKERQVASNVQALLRLTIKNGVPLFKFMVGDNSKVLAATLKNLKSCVKDDSDQNYTFFFVNEIKRKSGGWIRSGSREKSCGYVYNVVGEMKVSSHFLDLRRQTSNGKYMMRESVLMGSKDQESMKFIPSSELAAVVLRIPIQRSSHDEPQSAKDLMEEWMKCLQEDRCCNSNLSENGDTDNAVVILPEGVHGSPSNGEPSSLIHRWKSGGSCDCGGWDIGCKLRVLSNEQQFCKISNACPMPDRLELFVKGGVEQNMPTFCLEPCKDGIFSVEFNSSISMLQAFFISVSFLSCQKASNLSEVTNTMFINGTHDVRDKLPGRYAPNPPPSPAGRV